MTRPIKFIAWDKETKEMITVRQMMWSTDMMPLRLTHLCNGTVLHSADGYDLYQFTGLLDNETELYEGHRVEVDLPRGDTVDGTIVFEQGVFAIKFDEGWSGLLGVTLMDSNVKIIGHVAEGNVNEQ